MPRASRHGGPTHAGSAAVVAQARAAAAAEARAAEAAAARLAGAHRYAMARADVDAHHADLRWVLERAIEHAVAGDDAMADWTVRHAVHAGVGVVELCRAFAELGAIRAPSAGAS